MPQPIANEAALTESVHLKCSTALLNVIDKASAANFSSRSDFIRGAVVERLRRDGMIIDSGQLFAAALAQRGAGQ